MGGTELEVKLDTSQNAVSWLKLATQDEQGVSTFAQQLSLVSKGGDNNAGGVSAGGGGKQGPLKDDYLLSDSSIVALRVVFFSSFG